jgi:small-conductance mechanosensitive channel
MSQVFPPRTDTLVQLDLPDQFERLRDLYVPGAVQQLIVFLLLALGLYVLVHLARQLVTQQVPDVNRRHIIRKWIGYGYGLLLILIAVALFADALTGFGTILAVILAGVAISLQDVLKSVVGWLYISGRSGVQVGSRIEVDGVIGDVIDIGFFKTTVLEIGNLVFGRQSTGRMVTVPNSKMIASSVYMSTPANPFVWQEIRILVTFESDWRRAEEIMREIAYEIHEEIAPELAEGFQKLERKYAFKYGTLTPIVYVSIAENGVELDLRFLIPVRRRRGSVDRVSRRILDAFAAEPDVRIAYPTYRIFRRGENAEEASAG